MLSIAILHKKALNNVLSFGNRLFSLIGRNEEHNFQHYFRFVAHSFQTQKRDL